MIHAIEQIKKKKKEFRFSFSRLYNEHINSRQQYPLFHRGENFQQGNCFWKEN